jgi:hypothetical protein
LNGVVYFYVAKVVGQSLIPNKTVTRISLDFYYKVIIECAGKGPLEAAPDGGSLMREYQ